MSEPKPITFEQRLARSSQVLMAAYIEKTKELSVVFLGGRPISYVYQDVPQALWDEMQKADSIGSFIYHKLKNGGFKFEKFDLPPETYEAYLASRKAVIETLPETSA